jgi:hypothetical protein
MKQWQACGRKQMRQCAWFSCGMTARVEGFSTDEKPQFFYANLQ